MSRDNKDIIVGLDIGTSKIVALVAEITPEDRLNIIGMGSQDSRGLKKGVVVNIEETVATISRVLQEVELMADCKVKDVYTGIAGSHIARDQRESLRGVRCRLWRLPRHPVRPERASDGRGGRCFRQRLHIYVWSAPFLPT